VLINFGERAELGTEEFLPVEDITLENFVIVKENPLYQKEQERAGKFIK